MIRIRDVFHLTNYVDLQESEREAFWAEERKKSRPACFISEMELRQLEKLQQEHLERVSGAMESTSILGQVRKTLSLRF